MTDDMDKILGRIQKLHAKAESAKAIGSEQEALAFAEAVQKMLLKHDLEMSDVEAAALDRDNPIRMHTLDPRDFDLPFKRRRVAWTEQLAAVVARAHQCDIIVIPSSNTVMLVGRRRDRAVAEHVIVVLTRWAAYQAEKDYVKFFYHHRDHGTVSKARGYKAGWLAGFVVRLHERYKAELARMTAEAQVAGHGMALMRITNQLAKVKEVVKELGDGKASKVTGPRASDAGFIDGKRRADEVSLTGTGLENSESPGMLRAGQRQLGRGSE